MEQQSQKVVIVTGANKGIGYATVEKLIQQYPNYKVILTARNPTFGEEARQKLVLKYPSAQNNLFFHKLDIRNTKDQDALVETIRSNYGKLDILVNNAGITSNVAGVSDTYEDIFVTNYNATVDLTEKLLPLLSDDGRILMVSSILALLSNQVPEYEKFLSQPQTHEQINAKLKELEKFSLTAKPEELAKFAGIYSVSKAFLNGYARWVLSPKLKSGQSVVAIHPGWCETDNSGFCNDEEWRKIIPPKTAEQGTKTILYVIGLDNEKIKEVNNKFLDDETNVIAY